MRYVHAFVKKSSFGFVLQSNYTKRLLKRFYMDQENILRTPMVNRTLDVERDPFRPNEDIKNILCPYVSYMRVKIGFLYLANFTRPDISFATNPLARYSYAPIRRHQNEIKHIFNYLQGTVDLELIYHTNPDFGIVGFEDA